MKLFLYRKRQVEVGAFVNIGFGDWIFKGGLIDLGFLGQKFTWIKNPSAISPLKLRLDRALCNSEWKSLFAKAYVRHLFWVLSDHTLVLISLHTMHIPDLKLTAFQFEALRSSEV